MVWLKRVGRLAGVILVLFVIWVSAAAIVYSPEYALRVLRSGESSFEDYLDTFPLSPLSASASPFHFEVALDEAGVRATFEEALGVDDLDQFLTETDTQAFIVVKDGVVLYEDYYNGFQRDSMLTSFSVAKSFDSALIGIALGEGHIGSVDDSITDYLPELAERDAAFTEITIRDVLRMAAGLDYQEIRWWLFNGDDPLTTYYPDQREIALENINIVDPPGQYFNYNKYHPQLLGMILERTTGMSVTEYTQTRLWDPLGMEFDGAWALDGEESQFEKMEAGLNARAIDYAKFGQLFLQGGVWEGVQVVPEEWVSESTSLDPSTQNVDYYSHSFGDFVYIDGDGYYRYMWYGRLRDGQPADYFAEGDHGQTIYVSPANGVVIVRNGTEYGISAGAWVDGFFQAAEDL